jgi:hypothetical protein
MSDSGYSTNAGGIGFAGGLTLLFIGLKITHVIDWSWWWVLSPLWITALFGLAIFGLAMLVLGKIK